MQKSDWKKTKEILNSVLEIEPSERQAFLDSFDLPSELRDEIASLLAFEEKAENFMSVTAGNFSKELVFEDESARTTPVGQRIGIYEITRELGCGGMGAVYLAGRADGKFEQQVAIKMLKREFNTEKIRRRFTREREIQSKLVHPNIALLLDAGTTEDKIPYLVMEYVEGLPIDEFCRANALGLDERLELFRKVCAAVAFAHRSLVIHRDLKPSNILVTNAGEPKLLDFGISKLLGERPDEARTVTALGAMTPEYASPEQIRGERVTTATDVYSLGVVLYKILTGALPFEAAGKTSGELLRTITETEPTAPSRVLSDERGTMSDELKTKKENSVHRTSFIAHHSLRGDLDNIILKALRKEPERRYATVEQLADDIRRFVDGRPISARRATFSYQASKFYRRNKIPVLAGVLIVVSLFAGIALALWQAKAARAQAQIASEAQKQAELGTEKAEKISRFMSKILSYANPAWYAEGAKSNGEARVIDVVYEMSEKIDVEFAGQPDIQSELHHKFAEVFALSGRNTARSDESRQKSLYHARRAIELRKQFYGERHELVAKDMFYLYVAGGVERKDRAPYLAEAIRMMRETNPKNLNLPYMLEAYTSRLMLPDSEQYHEEYLRAASPATGENKYQIAERYLLESLPVFREHYREDNLAIFSNECKLAYALVMQNKFAAAEPHYRICRKSAENMPDENQSKSLRIFLSHVEDALKAKNFSFSP